VHNNAFLIHPRKPPIQRPPTRTPERQAITRTPKHKWSTFTYIGKETTFISNTLKNTNLKIPFHTNNTVQKITNAQTTGNGHTYTVRSTRTDMPRQQESVRGTNCFAVTAEGVHI